MGKTYVTAITQFLDDAGELKEMPATARRMADFLVSIIDAVTRVYPTVGHDGLAASSGAAKPRIQASLHIARRKGHWWCPICEQYGLISNWQGTQWDHTAGSLNA